MDLELVTIGTELLLGFTLDTNSSFSGQALAEVGIRVTRRTTVPDEPPAVRDAVSGALARSRLVLTTGGLGPTRDDLSKQAVASVFGLPLEFREDIWAELVQRWARLGRRISERNRVQAEVPRGALVLPNRWGTAPGLWITGEPGEVVMLPGVPNEMRNLLTHEVLPRLAARSGGKVVRSRVLRTTGIPESNLAGRLAPAEESLGPVTLAYLPSLLGVDLRLTAWEVTPEEADRALSAAVDRLRPLLGEHCYGEAETDLAAVLLEQCRRHELRLAVAESCTGGLVGGRLTAVPGSSDVFLGGVVCYADGAKQNLAQVPAETLAAHGAVSEETVRAMAAGIRRRLDAEIGAAVSGIAGPRGGTPENPVGTIWTAWDVQGSVEAHQAILPGCREEIRTRAVQLVLYGLWRRLADWG